MPAWEVGSIACTVHALYVKIAVGMTVLIYFHTYPQLHIRWHDYFLLCIWFQVTHLRKPASEINVSNINTANF